MMKIHRGFICLFLLVACVAGISRRLAAQDEGDAWGKKKSSWLLLSAAERAQAQEFSEDYKSYLNVARSAYFSNRK